MSSSRFLRALKPAIRVMPEIRPPDRKVSFREKILWTVLALIIFLVMSQIPLYGIDPTVGKDYMYWMRVIMASSRGTLMELGIGPIVTAGLVMQLLVGSQIIKVNFANPEDRANYTGAQKVMSIVMTLFNAGAYIFAQAYGDITIGQQILVFVQLIFGGIIVMMLDEMIQKGWGIGSGISLFIAANVTQQVLWGAFSMIPTPPPYEDPPGDGLFRGAILAFIQQMILAFQEPARWLEHITGAFIRPSGYPGMLAVIATVIVFLVVIYVESVRVEMPISHARYKGFTGKYPIKLLYTSNIPVILVQALYANALFITQIIQPIFNPEGTNFWVNLLGTFETGADFLTPTWGIVYFLTPPRGVEAVLQDPIRAAIYAVVLVLLCGVFSSVWIEVAGQTSRDVARQLISSGVVVPGFRRSPVVLEKLLNRYIPTLALLGGLLMGVLATFADFLNALGTGAGILLTVGILQQYVQIIGQEQMAEMSPVLRDMMT